jgi:hypothetical protein
LYANDPVALSVKSVIEIDEASLSDIPPDLSDAFPLLDEELSRLQEGGAPRFHENVEFN